MDSTIALLLLRDGLTAGAIYAMLGVAMVLVFTVTRVLFVPQGEFVAFAALSMVAFEEGRVPGIAGLMLVAAVLATVSQLVQSRKTLNGRLAARIVALELGLPGLLWLLVNFAAPAKPGLAVSIGLTVALSTLLGMAVYRIVFQPLQQASVLVLLIAAFGVHMVLLGLGLYFFGPEGFQTLPLVDQAFELGGLRLKAGDLIVLASAALLMLALAGFFARTMAGKALRASAVNRIGASLVGIATARTGVIAFALAAAVGAVSGILIGPVTTVYYDTGFMIGLKGLVAAVLGGLVSFPATVLAALLLAVFESACAFWASGYKEVLVFLLLLPVLLWRSFALPHGHEDDEE
jgi:branched-chain amino acid transport system permease protein